MFYSWNKNKKPHRKQLLNSWKLSLSIWRTVNVDGGLDLFCIVQELFFWLSKQICHPIRKVLESNVKPCKGNNNQDMPSYENLRKHEFTPSLQSSSSCCHSTDEETVSTNIGVSQWISRPLPPLLHLRILIMDRKLDKSVSKAHWNA